MTNKTARGRGTIWAGAIVATATALLGGLTAAPAQAWYDNLEACKNAYGYEHYLGWDIPTVVVRKGASGVCVREIQEDLLEVGAVRSEDQPGFVDGVFGPKTYNAVVNFQNRTSVQGGADGVVGRYTWHSLIAHVYFE
ncbi:peptidoglycan-binding domain-containing protein [Streptomyces graminilatus]|uniref:peptidoglycan-binding domain-containing protein n=1 Tax=Streptomyces graminilatus TaxID=1464070 RepID=UPI0006E2C085|nr:peptidoglycan-binding protein [Streptomyces graminilatus]